MSKLVDKDKIFNLFSRIFIYSDSDSILFVYSSGSRANKLERQTSNKLSAVIINGVFFI